MEANGDVTDPPVRLNGDEGDNERKRLLERPDDEPATKRAKAEDGSAVARNEYEPHGTVVKPLPKGTAPVKQE